MYVGLSVDIEKRWKRHKYELKNNSHHNEYLQRTWNKYGKGCFNFEIIELCDSSLLNKREIFWINYYNSYKDGYNSTSGGEGRSGYHLTKETKDKIRKNRGHYRHTQETKNKISEIQKGRKLTKEWKKNISKAHKENIKNGSITPNTYNLTNHIEKTKRKIKCYNKNGEIVGTYQSIQGAGRELNIQATNICKVLKGKYNTSNGLTFCYNNEYLDKKEIEKRFSKCFTKIKTNKN